MANGLSIAPPSTTIWGRVQHREKLAEGVYNVETAGHGGVVVNKLVADKYLSDKAKFVAGHPEYGWYHFEEDCDWAVFANENRDIVPEKWLEYIDGSLERWNPDYLTKTVEQMKAERDAKRKKEQEARERYEARQALENNYRQQLTGEWDCDEKTIETVDDITFIVRKTDKPEKFMCKILSDGRDLGNLELGIDFLLTMLMDFKKRTS